MTLTRAKFALAIYLALTNVVCAIYQGHDVTGQQARDAVGVVKISFPGEDPQGGPQLQYGSGVVLGNGKCLLSAAHVVKDHQKDLLVYKNSITTNSAGAAVVSTTTDTINALSVHAPRSYDFAVVKLNGTLPASPWNVTLTRGGYEDKLSLFGWGYDDRNRNLPVSLKRGTVSHTDVAQLKCSTWKNTVGAMCLTSRGARELNCGGDSGGPGVAETTVNGNKLTTVMGIISENTGAGLCGAHLAGLLASLSGVPQKTFLNTYAGYCGWTFAKYDMACFEDPFENGLRSELCCNTAECWRSLPRPAFIV